MDSCFICTGVPHGTLRRDRRAHPICISCVYSIGDPITDAGIREHIQLVGMPAKRGWDDSDDDAEPGSAPVPLRQCTVAPSVTGPRVLARMRWFQYNEQQAFRFHAYVSADITVRQLLGVFAREFAEPMLLGWMDENAVYGIRTRSGVQQLELDQRLYQVADDGAQPPRLDLEANSRPDEEYVAFDYDDGYYGTRAADAQIQFTVVAPFLDRECDVPPVSLGDTWLDFLSAAVRACPALADHTANLAGRVISRATGFRGVDQIIDARAKIGDTLAWYVNDLDGGVRIHFD